MVDEVGLEELADHGGSATQSHVEPSGEFSRERERLVRRDIPEEKLGLAHDEVGAWMMGEHDDRRMEGRLLTPPSAPVLVLPRTGLRTELSATMISAPMPSQEAAASASSMPVVPRPIASLS